MPGGLQPNFTLATRKYTGLVAPAVWSTASPARPGLEQPPINFGSCGRLTMWPMVGKTGGLRELDPGPFAHRADRRDPHDRGGADGVRSGSEDSDPGRPSRTRSAAGDSDRDRP